MQCLEADARALPTPTGVSWVYYKQQWSASIWANGRTNYLGLFDDEEAAARAYDAAATAILAEPRLNFNPDGSINPDRHRRGMANT